MKVKNTIRGLIATIYIILIFTCPILEVSKLLLFNLTKQELTLQNEIIEIIYLIAMTIFPIGLIATALKNLCCNMGGLMSHLKEQLCCLPFLILIIASIYTHLTSQDMTPIPSTCPSNYPYKLSLTRVACFIRLINLIIMWTFTTLLFILTIVDCFGYFPTNNRGRDNTIQSRLSDFFPPDRDDDIGMTEKRIK
ncbi:uncharacterized protein OCT59_007988 [Rhizophagus irregularis]|uniref:Uncharacterized protein n=5 Tax=Rhizophagus irregularis TaxID=588596 RepID=A0A2P4QGE4_RHIID|nr:hypothetical protein GLOIN_2v1553582 [Rhizophagus irregularis DAOM 181602=DAOM 197198]UZO16603.1 hypothetical protein OCT59_007988 [Rhizophagus irregularis]POG76712.1 hypothetical protein GLOIN_2v1553582 [Rhizophagus irregularis DAOM 181602=DAOM 197198]CAB4382537.1 unnamed protein product [Rhizophagus irregularis]CAB4487419.1 unnamed protein product [Rhizophagus irregularis]CAB5188001.1 unnamed protein product [Rhizophagus irregularis]|eukprot:XP_025183578.1 hypothetical protein GLOIN_2v1553582 [Rhizophagus irregularis DAOM 181602=DAOM 197198]